MIVWFTIITLVLGLRPRSRMVISLVPRPTLTRGETSTDTSGAGFINIDCFLGGGGGGGGGGNFPTANQIAENTICGCNTGNPWLLQHDDTTQHFFGA